MSNNKVYITVCRHERYGVGDTPIWREGMVRAWQTGNNLRQILPPCDAIYHSPLARAKTTAEFQALGLQCNHLLQVDELSEDTPKFEVQKFFNRLLQYSNEDSFFYSFVTHLPVIEKFGLPFLAAGDVCLLTADNREQMLAENFTLEVISAAPVSAETWQKIDHTPTTIEALSSAEIYGLLNKFGCRYEKTLNR